MPFLSVVILTRNRPEQLRQCLPCLEHQDFDPDGCQIVVVDDGSDSSTSNPPLGKYRTKGRYLTQRPPGPAAARNLGVGAASGQVTVFIGDDVLTQSDFLQARWSRYSVSP